jgi:hypothetical protein
MFGTPEFFYWNVFQSFTFFSLALKALIKGLYNKNKIYTQQNQIIFFNQVALDTDVVLVNLTHLMSVKSIAKK